jgi:phage replication O-like protein O
LSGAEYQLVLFIIDKTWGFNKTFDQISYSQMQEATGLSRRGIIRIIKSLEKQRILVIDRKKIKGSLPVNEYLFNKHYDTWLWKTGDLQDTSINKTGDLQDTRTGDIFGNKLVTKWSPTKEIVQKKYKEIILSQIKNLLSLFPELLQEEIQVYWDNAAQKNKTGIITEGRKLTLLTELYNLMKRTNNDNLFEHALETANRYGVPNIGYVGAIIKNKITEVIE